jgi:hypothetical protein
MGVLALSLLQQPGTSNSAPAEAVATTDTAETPDATTTTRAFGRHANLSLVVKFAARLTARLAVLLGMAMALSTLAQSQMKCMQAAAVGTGIELVALFDLAGMLQRQPELRLDRLRARGFDTADWEAGARATFSAERIARLEMRPVTGPRELDGKPCCGNGPTWSYHTPWATGLTGWRCMPGSGA